MFISKTFGRVSHPVTTHSCRDTARNHQVTMVAGDEITSLYTSLQAELWDALAPVRCKCEVCDQSLEVVDVAPTGRCIQCAMYDRSKVSAIPLRGGACYLHVEDFDAATDSLRKQLTTVLRQARQHRAWIPLNQVFMDLGPKSDDQMRLGFMSLVSLINDPDTSASVIYVDKLSLLEPDHRDDDLFCLAAQLCGKTVYSVAEHSAG